MRPRFSFSVENEFYLSAHFLGVTVLYGVLGLQSGVPRTGYRGVVSFLYKGRRVYLAPSANWKGYDPGWS
jgi:GNT-I family.